MLTPRRFVSISRAVNPSTGDQFLDAVADDGSAWWRVFGNLDDGRGWTEWAPMTPLPPGSEPD